MECPFNIYNYSVGVDIFDIYVLMVVKTDCFIKLKSNQNLKGKGNLLTLHMKVHFVRILAAALIVVHVLLCKDLNDKLWYDS